MAHLVAAMASVHIPSLLAAPQRFTPEAWEKFQQGFGTLRHTLTTAGVDTIVVISDEHFNTLELLTPRGRLSCVRPSQDAAVR